ncbi:MAG TPA: hypothetical protein VFS09_06540 [Candidatus Eisenbacteria bacterium]|nr:hypothetical protein [Candidatus Eisenbacteria bacterium]
MSRVKPYVEGLGFARIATGRPVDDRRAADERLRSMAEREVMRPEWKKAPEPVKRAFVALYGRASAPEKLNGWAEHTAVKWAIMLSGPRKAQGVHPEEAAR